MESDWVQIGAIRLPRRAIIRDNPAALKTYAARTILRLLREGVPPLTLVDAVFLTTQASLLRIIGQRAEPSQRLTQAVVASHVYEGISNVAFVATPLLAALDIPATYLPHAFAASKNEINRVVSCSIDDPERVAALSRVVAQKIADQLGSFVSKYGEWVRGPAREAATRDGRKNPNRLAISSWDTTLAQEQLGARVASYDRTRAELLLAIRRKRPHLLESGEDATEFLHEALFGKEMRPGGGFYWGNDGLLHRNVNRDADRLDADRRGRHSELADDIPGGIDVAEAVAAAEAVQLVHQLQERCRERGPSSEAAFCYLSRQVSTRGETAERFGVSEKAMRHAEKWVDAQLGKIRRAAVN